MLKDLHISQDVQDVDTINDLKNYLVDKFCYFKLPKTYKNKTKLIKKKNVNIILPDDVTLTKYKK